MTIHFAPITELSIPKGCRSVVVIADDKVGALYGSRVQEILPIPSTLLTFPHGEHNKNRKTKEELEDQMCLAHIDRSSVLIGLGGGVTLDLAGYIAATFMRGISFISIPTTLLAAVDAAIGGKNGINTPFGKNLIGTFYEPSSILVDLDFLNTLDPAEIRCGFAEMVKHALIADRSYFDFLEAHVEPLLNLERGAILEAVHTSIIIKQTIIKNDLREQGQRVVLNFGHTSAHALELLSDYTLLHGDAVAKGMIYELELSTRLKGFPVHDVNRATVLLERFGFDLTLGVAEFEPYMNAMRGDKKKIENTPRFVLLENLGKLPNHPYCSDIEERILREAFNREFKIKNRW